MRDQAEVFRFVACFINRGLGCAETTPSGGDLTNEVSMTEYCNPRLDRTFLRLSSASSSVENGACQAPTDLSMSELGVPGFATPWTPAWVEAMTCAADHGVAGCR